jgi:hypothetical protein
MACTDNFIFCTTQQFNCANSCCAVCHSLCYSYSQSVATFSPLIAPSIQRTVSILYPTTNIQSDTSFLHTVSDRTTNVTLNSTARYNHYVSITVHSCVYVLMFCFLHSQLHKANMKTLFARHVKPWPVCIVTFSAECDALGTLPHPFLHIC